MKLRIKRISPSSLSLTLGAIYFVFGCIAALLGAAASLFGAQVTLGGPLGFTGTGFAAMPLHFITPFISALMGGFSGYVIAWIYNLISRYTRGVVIETEEAGKYDALF